MKRRGENIPVIHVQIRDEPDLQAWAQSARAQHQKLPDVIKALIRQSLTREKTVNGILQEMFEKMERMEQDMRAMVERRDVAPSVDTFVRNPAPNYDAAAEALFEDAPGVGWD